MSTRRVEWYRTLEDLSEHEKEELREDFALDVDRKEGHVVAVLTTKQFHQLFVKENADVLQARRQIQGAIIVYINMPTDQLKGIHAASTDAVVRAAIYAVLKERGVEVEP